MIRIKNCIPWTGVQNCGARPIGLTLSVLFGVPWSPSPRLVDLQSPVAFWSFPTVRLQANEGPRQQALDNRVRHTRAERNEWQRRSSTAKVREVYLVERGQGNG